MAERHRHDKRTQKRFTKRCEVEFVSKGVKLRGIASNFSLTGLFIRTNHPPVPDATLDLLVFLSDSLTSRLKVKVVRACKTPTGKVMGKPVKSGTNGIGVKIIERDADYLNFFKSLLNCRMEHEDNHRGVIEETAPDPVATRERKDLSPTDVVAVLTRVVKQQQQSLDEQKATIDAKSQIIEEQQKTLETLAAAVARLEAEMTRLKREDREMPKEVLKEMFGEKAEQPVDPQVRAMIDDMHQKYEGLGYYGVLGVKDYAPADEIKKAYYKIARKFHPDMHFHLDDASLKDELSDIFAFIYKAYATLSDPQKRKDYDEWITLKPTKLTSNPDKARAKFEEGKGELRRNRYSEAELLFGQATYFDSTVAEYHYYYGLLLMKQKKFNEAEKALRKALQLEPANANYLAELGSVYLELGFPTRAKGFFERALEISPDNVRALEGLSKKPVCLTSRQDQFNSCHLYYAES